MVLAVFDIGGTAVKYGKWEQESLGSQGKFSTPATWAEMKQQVKETIAELQEDAEAEISGVAFSSPGSVYTEEGIIRGISAVPYLHHFPIRKELSSFLGLPVSMENDAYCAALAEARMGAAADVENAVFIVIGTGVGGAVMLNRQLIKGNSMFGGEFGYMLLEESRTFSELASPVRMAHSYREEMGEARPISGMELFERAAVGDEVAQRYVSLLKKNLARGIQNLLVAFNPEKVVIGGGISARVSLIEDVSKEVEGLLKRTGAAEAAAGIVACQFHNDANLIGAVAAFHEQIKNQ